MIQTRNRSVLHQNEVEILLAETYEELATEFRNAFNLCQQDFRQKSEAGFVTQSRSWKANQMQFFLRHLLAAKFAGHPYIVPREVRGAFGLVVRGILFVWIKKLNEELFTTGYMTPRLREIEQSQLIQLDGGQMSMDTMSKGVCVVKLGYVHDVSWRKLNGIWLVSSNTEEIHWKREIETGQSGTLAMPLEVLGEPVNEEVDNVLKVIANLKAGENGRQQAG